MFIIYLKKQQYNQTYTYTIHLYVLYLDGTNNFIWLIFDWLITIFLIIANSWIISDQSICFKRKLSMFNMKCDDIFFVSQNRSVIILFFFWTKNDLSFHFY